MTDRPVIKPGATIGILGGGQLGRMLALSAAKLGMKTHIYCPDPQSPAFDVTPHKTIAEYTDRDALARFAEAVDIVTYEFENVPLETAQFIDAKVPLAPGPRALGISQDRLDEKSFLRDQSIAVAPFAAINTHADLEHAISEIGLPCVLKTRRLGYDGKGQRMIDSQGEAGNAFAELGGTALILEGFIAFEREISILVARAGSGEISLFDPAENVHKNHILKTSTVPAAIDEQTAKRAGDIGKTIAEALDYVGVLAVEFFVKSGAQGAELIVNEIAPRVHNSGHWTESVCPTSQFEQHIRAICNWPLGDATRLADVEMENLIGDEVLSVPGAIPAGVQPHLYGKAEARSGRKMGHINRVKRG